MLTIEDLELEVICLILEFVDDSSPQTTKAVACVNRYFNSITQNIAHRHRTIDLRGQIDGGTIRTIDSWTSNPVVLANIRTLTVKGRLLPVTTEGGYPDDGVDVDSVFWGPLVKLVSEIGGLRQLSWNILWPLPLAVLDALERHQRRATLKIFQFAVASPHVLGPESIVSRLAQSAALTHLRRAGNEHTNERLDLHEIAFRSIVASAPKLEYVGLVRRPIDFSRNLLLLTEAEQAQTSLYPYQKPNGSVRQLTLDGVEISRRTLDEWSTLIDLGGLENVKFSRGVPTLDYFAHAARMLPNLKHLSLNLRSVQNRGEGPEKAALVSAIQDYITTCAPLRTLSLWSWMGLLTLPDILQRHGTTLQSLHLHEREPDSDTRAVLSVADVELINTSCPDLRSLSIDLNRTRPRLVWKGDRNRAYYAELARFKHLSSLQIYLDNGWSYMRSSPRYDSTANDDGDGYSYSANTDDDDDDDDGDEDVLVDAPVAAVQSSSNAIHSVIGQQQHQQSDRREFCRPSREIYLVPYVKRIWAAVFGQRHSHHSDSDHDAPARGGARRLDVKSGEWEGRPGLGMEAVEYALRRHLIVRPHERDDVDEPVVTVLRKHR